MLKKWFNKIRTESRSQDLAKTAQEELVTHLILHTAALGLKKSEWVELAPVKGACGNFILSGNSLPVFLYTVFDKSIMEFVQMRVEIAKPDQIRYLAAIKAVNAETKAKEIEVKEQYKKPFETLAQHLKAYFPFPLNTKGQHNGPFKTFQVQSDATRSATVSGQNSQR